MSRLGTLKPLVRTSDHRTCRPLPKQADAELQTKQHREWRLEVLKQANWRCEKCTARGGRGGVQLYADHIVERRDGGEPLDPANGMALCPSCHTKKTAAERARRMGEQFEPQ